MKFSKAVSLAILAGAVATLTGCAYRSPIPLAENFQLTVQPKVRSAGHWEILSQDVVSQTLGTLEKAGIAPGTQLHVALPPNPSAFDLAFRDFLITRMVQSGAPVLQKDSWAAAVVDELEQKPEDIKVDKHRISGFWDTPLDSILKNLGIKSILFAGCNTDQCVLHTLTDANFLGYGCVMLEDCCASPDPELHRIEIEKILPLFATVTASEVLLKAL